MRRAHSSGREFLNHHNGHGIGQCKDHGMHSQKGSLGSEHSCQPAAPDSDIFHFTQNRQYNMFFGRPHNVVAPYLSKQLPGLLQEKEYRLGAINKIFASQWVSDRQVVFGTKCNKLIVMDLQTKQMARIPSLRSSDESLPADIPCGIHSIAVNPSKTLLATGAENTNDLAVYKLPTFDPVAVGELGHTDWIFDVKWLDDQFVVTGSRDSKLALWKISDDDPGDIPSNSATKCLQVPEYNVLRPVSVKGCTKAEKVRAMAYNDHTQVIAALSLNAYLHFWDARTFTQVSNLKLTYPRENVCMGLSKEKNMYAIGSQSYVTVIDPRQTKHKGIISKLHGCGIRSVNFNEDVLSIGTGAGMVYFFDTRAWRYLELPCGHSSALSVGKGWLRHDDTYRDYFMDGDYPNAIYTHCYDDSGTRLFTAGGPLPAGLWGNYAGLWH